MKFIERQTADVPFFLYVPFTCPHSPFQGPEDRQEDPLPLDSTLWNQGNAPPDVYVAMIERMDERIGDMLKTLETSGLAKNTVVFFASDNGGTKSARNAPFSGFKGSTMEGGIRVPAIIRWPGKIPAGIVSDQPCITFDLTASMARLAGVEPAADQPFDGIDILQHVIERRQDVPRTLFWRKPRGETVWSATRNSDLKYVSKLVGDRREEYLFDLATDPGEQSDLKNVRAGDFERLRKSYLVWEETVRRNRRGRPE
jgi:N-acetylgalactosamine-6-sulfatase